MPPTTNASPSPTERGALVGRVVVAVWAAFVYAFYWITYLPGVK